MFEKLSGFFKQFTSRRKRQSGETTIMESKEPGVDEFGLDEGFGDTDSFGDGSSPGASDELDTFGDTGEPDFGGGGDYPETAGLADTGGFGDSDDMQGDVSAQFAAPTGPEGSVEEAFSDFDMTGGSGEIGTGGTDFDARTVSDEITGPTGDDFGATDGDFGGAFDVGDSAAPIDDGMPTQGSSSPVKTILIACAAAILAVGVGAGFQMFAWPPISKMVGLTDAAAVAPDPVAQLGEGNRKKVRLTKELGAFKEVGAPAQVEELKAEVAAVRDAQGTVEDVEAGFEKVKTKEVKYDALKNKISQIETDITRTGSEIVSAKADIETTKQRVVELARQTDEEYERFRFELTRAELGQRLLIELRLRDITSLKTDMNRFEERLSKLSAQSLTMTSVEAEQPDEAAAAETIDN